MSAVPRTVSRTARRTLVATLPAVVACVALLAFYLALRHQLPERLATHFGVGGQADAFDTPGTFLTVGFGVLAGAGVMSGALVCVMRAGPRQQRVMAVLGGGATVLVGVVVVDVLRVNAGGGDVRLPAWHVLVALGAAVAYAGLGWLLAGAYEPPADGPSAPSAHVPRLELAVSEVASWSHVAGSPLLRGVGVVMAVAGVGVGVAAGWAGGVGLGVAGVVTALCSGARVTVDRNGLTVRPVALPRPRVRLPLERITEASARRVEPLRDFGGWGYRVVPGASGVVLRTGDAVAVRLAHGSEFVVTVDDAGTAAGLLNALRERQAG
ncbi:MULTISPECIES: DUF1648 domain-containing protein [Streptomyces]|uniref:DUF1648 domain-containing protein n=1 Tax=Streptomyces luteosporeus TaxID=173856 RepID=A0ABN3TT51_9ACTN